MVNYNLDTTPSMALREALDNMDGVYLCIKDKNSVFLWVNDNFAALFGKKPEDFIGNKDTQAPHVQHDIEVMESGVPLLNFNETIQIPDKKGGYDYLEIVTQKGLLRKKNGSIIGITVCFSKKYPEADQLIEKYKMFETGIGGYIAPVSLDKDAPYSMNYFLLKKGDVLDLHKLKQDEQWFFHEGSAIKIHIFSKKKGYSTKIFGSDSSEGQSLNGFVPHGTWFGAEVIAPSYAFVTCSLAPAWKEKDSSSPTENKVNALINKFPEQEKIIKKLTSKKRK